jgi:rSAM/selenodomain-associated transferase 1
MLLDTCREALDAEVGPVELCLSGSIDDVPEGIEVTEQGEGDLGHRLARAAERVIGQGELVVFIGTDCPALDADRLQSMCRELERCDAVIHPTFDGGYALLGLKQYDPSIFSGIEWSTPSVAAATVARIAALGWSLHTGETLLDVDEPADLEQVQAARKASATPFMQ